MLDAYAGRLGGARLHSLVRAQRTKGQLPRDAVCSSFDVADFDPASPTIRVDASEPQMVRAVAIDQSLESRRKVFYLPTHE
jgi:hypothetical protein